MLFRSDIHTIGELAARDMAWLTQHFTVNTAQWLHDVSRGIDDRAVVTNSDPVSMSRETTFDRDLHAKRDRAELGAIFTELCTQVADDLSRKGWVGRTIGIKLRFDDFKTVTRDHSVSVPTADPAEIRQLAGLCLKRVDLTRRLRLLGVRVGNLSRPGAPAGAEPRGAKAKAGGQASTARPKPVEDARPDEPTLF